MVTSFAGKTVIVTGAAGGIGHAVASRFAAGDAQIVLADVRSVDETTFAGTGRKIFQPCDISDEAAVAALIDRTRDQFGDPDVIVNIAGAMIYKPIAELTGDDWRRIFDVNLLGAAYLTGHALRHMRAGGSIVNVGSVHARQTSPLVAPYAAAKAALCSLTRSAAIEGRERGIRANVILPGAIDTSMLWSSPNIASGAEVIAEADVGKPEDIAAAVTFLASDDARFINGAELLVEGGRLARL